MKVGAKRVIVVGIITFVLTLVALTVPPTTVVRFLGLDLTIVVFFRVVASLLFVGFMLEVVSNWGRRFISGRWGERVADFARGLSPAFVYMAPAEVAYIILFVAFAVNIPSGWTIFQVLFLPGLLLLPLVFNWRSFWISVKSLQNWLRPQYRKGIQHIKASQIPWRPLFIETAHDFLPALFWAFFGAVLTYAIEPSLFQRLGISIWLALPAVFLLWYFLKYLKWRYPTPPHQPSP